MREELARLKKRINPDMSDTSWYAFDAEIRLLERILEPEPKRCLFCGQTIKD